HALSSLVMLRPPRPTLLPYTTLFRSATVEIPDIQHTHLPCLRADAGGPAAHRRLHGRSHRHTLRHEEHLRPATLLHADAAGAGADRKSTRLNSSHVKISYAVFCLKKK